MSDASNSAIGWGLPHSTWENVHQRKRILKLRGLLELLADTEPREPPTEPYREPTTRAAEAIELYQAGISATQIAQARGVPYDRGRVDQGRRGPDAAFPHHGRAVRRGTAPPRSGILVRTDRPADRLLGERGAAEVARDRILTEIQPNLLLQDDGTDLDLNGPTGVAQAIGSGRAYQELNLTPALQFVILNGRVKKFEPLK